MMRRRFGGVIAAVVSAMAVVLSAAVPAAAVAATPSAAASRRDVVVIAFQTNWNSVARECAETYGPEGVGYVQVSPPQETITGTQWWTSYQPVSYRLDSKLGTEAEFKAMTAACRAAGVGVIADAVVNHMAGADRSGTGVAGSAFDGEGNFPAVPYTAADFHDCTANVSNYRRADNVQNCRLSGLQDLDTGSATVRGRLADYLARLLDMGVAGFRVDAVKHIAAGDVVAIKAELAARTGRDMDGVLFEQEVIGNASEAREIQPSNYLGTGKVSEFRFDERLAKAFGGDIDSGSFGLSGIGSGSGWVPSGKAAVWVTNWDTERDGSALTYRDGAQYLLANAFMLAYGYGQPHVYSGYRFASKDDGAPGATDVSVPDMTCPTDGSGSDGSGANGSETNGTWQCAQRWTAIRGMIGFHNAVAGTKVTDWRGYGANVIGFGRGKAGYLAINNGDWAVTRTFATSLPAGVYCNVYASGDCSAVVAVKADGTFEATLPAGSAVAVHVGATRRAWSGSAGRDGAAFGGVAHDGTALDPADPDWFVDSAAEMADAQSSERAGAVMDAAGLAAIVGARRAAGFAVLAMAAVALVVALAVTAMGRLRKGSAKPE